MKIEWKITNENREIAGYNCRKAVGKIFGDVYVFAFYTDEIMISGGPCSINGLPGMILGLTIPRLHTSFVATKVDLKNIAATEIVPVKAKKVYTEKELRTTLTDVTKDWFTYGDDEAEKKKRKDLFFWNAFL
jgi:GLPGLI family protein